MQPTPQADSVIVSLCKTTRSLEKSTVKPAGDPVLTSTPSESPSIDINSTKVCYFSLSFYTYTDYCLV